MDANLLKEAIADAKAKRQTELYWCKCVADCLCGHCKPLKLKIAMRQVQEKLAGNYEKRLLEILESGKYRMRNQQHTLSKESVDAIVKDLKEDECTCGIKPCVCWHDEK